VSEVMEIEPLADKWKAFGWEVVSCNGNNMQEILQAFSITEMIDAKPQVIIAETIMGKGVKSIENDYTWHGKAPDVQQAEEFIREIDHNNPD
jgi:transketolase